MCGFRSFLKSRETRNLRFATLSPPGFFNRFSAARFYTQRSNGTRHGWKVRAKGEGTIQELPNGKFRGRIPTPNGPFFGPTVAKRAEALPAARAELARRQESEESPEEHPFKICVGQKIEQMRSRLLRGGISPTTIDLWTSFQKRVESDPLGALFPSEITAAHVEAFRSRQKGATRTVQNYTDMATQALKELGNPVTIKRLKVPETVKRTLSQAEQTRLLSMPMRPDVRTMVLLALRMGLRRSEISGLRHEHRDGDGVVVKLAVVRSTGALSLKGPKNSKESWVPICPELLGVIGHGKGYVLQSEAGRPVSGSTLYDRWISLVSGTEFEDVGLHELRATYGMSLLEAGVDLRTAAEMMRHDPAVLARLYARSRRDLKQAAIKKLYGNG